MRDDERTGRRIVVPETRDLGHLLRMLEEHGADTVACLMIAIRDAPDPVPINAWLRDRFLVEIVWQRALAKGDAKRKFAGRERAWSGTLTAN